MTNKHLFANHLWLRPSTFSLMVLMTTGYNQKWTSKAIEYLKPDDEVFQGLRTSNIATATENIKEILSAIG